MNLSAKTQMEFVVVVGSGYSSFKQEIFPFQKRKNLLTLTPGLTLCLPISQLIEKWNKLPLRSKGVPPFYQKN